MLSSGVLDFAFVQIMHIRCHCYVGAVWCSTLRLSLSTVVKLFKFTLVVFKINKCLMCFSCTQVQSCLPVIVGLCVN
jgi:hypothetical protein